MAKLPASQYGGSPGTKPASPHRPLSPWLCSARVLLPKKLLLLLLQAVRPTTPGPAAAWPVPSHSPDSWTETLLRDLLSCHDSPEGPGREPERRWVYHASFLYKKKIKRVKLEKEKKKLDKRQAGEACGSLQGTLQSPRLVPAEGARHGALDHPRPRCTGMLFLT